MKLRPPVCDAQDTLTRAAAHAGHFARAYPRAEARFADGWHCSWVLSPALAPTIDEWAARVAPEDRSVDSLYAPRADALGYHH